MVMMELSSHKSGGNTKKENITAHPCMVTLSKIQILKNKIHNDDGMNVT